MAVERNNSSLAETAAVLQKCVAVTNCSRVSSMAAKDTYDGFVSIGGKSNFALPAGAA